MARLKIGVPVKKRKATAKEASKRAKVKTEATEDTAVIKSIEKALEDKAIIAKVHEALNEVKHEKSLEVAKAKKAETEMKQEDRKQKRQAAKEAAKEAMLLKQIRNIEGGGNILINKMNVDYFDQSSNVDTIVGFLKHYEDFMNDELKAKMDELLMKGRKKAKAKVWRTAFKEFFMEMKKSKEEGTMPKATNDKEPSAEDKNKEPMAEDKAPPKEGEALKEDATEASTKK